MFRRSTPRLAALTVVAGLVIVVAGCGGSDETSSDESVASAPAPPVAETSGTPTIGGTTSEPETLSDESDQMVELAARGQVAYTCTQSDPVITEMADSDEPSAEGRDEPNHDYPDGVDSDKNYFWNWGGSFNGGDGNAAEFDVTLFATDAHADAWAAENTDEEDIRYGRTVIRYYGLEDHGDYGDYNAEPLDTTAFTYSLHRCFDLAGNFD